MGAGRLWGELSPFFVACDREQRVADVREGCSWLYRPLPRPCAKARLFCFAHAGVGGSVFRLWPHGLPTGLELCAVQLPGRTTRLNEPPLTSITALADALVPAITPYLDVPFAFFGHSMGSVLSFETTRRLASGGLPLPSHLIVSGRRAPQIPDLLPPIYGLADSDFIAEISHRYGGIPSEIMKHHDVLELLLPCLRADIFALETYEPQRCEPLPCSISAFGGADDPLAPRSHLEAWRHETNDTFDVSIFPGGHFYIESQRAAVLAKISATLATKFGLTGRQDEESLWP